MQKAVRAIFGTVLVLSATGCIDDPLAEGREDGAWFRLNPSVAVVNAGGTTKVTAIVVNQQGAAINAPVTAEPCDAKISVVADSTRTAFEAPERFVVTGATLGETCVIVRGAGITDTTTIRVVPASIRVSGADTLGSGLSAQLALQYRNTAGQTVSGFGTSHFTWTALDTLVAVVTPTGQVSARAPGTGRIVATTLTSTGAVRADTLRLVVRAGAFTGTVTSGTLGVTGGSIPLLTFTQGAVPFDTDTQVRLLLNGAEIRTFNLTGTSTTTRVLAVPFGIPTGQLTYEVVNTGPNQIASLGTLPAIGTPNADPAEPDNTRAITPKAIVPGQVYMGSVSGDDFRDYVKVTITETGTYRLTVDWTDGSDHDAYVHTAAGTTLLTLEGAASVNPETGTVSITAPGDYFIRVEAYTFTPQGNRESTYRVQFVKI